MDKKKIIGIAVLAVVVVAGVLVSVLPKYIGKDSSGGSYQTTVEAIKINGSSGFSLEKKEVGGKIVPVIDVPLLTWGGYAGLIAANGGLEPSLDSQFYKNGGFCVNLIREEDPTVQLQGYANGKYPIIWSTMDMVPLLYDALKVDKRIMPKVFGIFDWSFGGDGVVVRGNINNPKELKGKKIVTSGNTPSNFFLLWVLAQSNLQPSDVVIYYVADAIVAKEVFEKDKSIDACVTWSPFIYDITDPSSKSYVTGAKLLITSKDANQLIADCYVARADFVSEYPEFVEAFSKSMMEGYDIFQKDKEVVYSNMAKFFGLSGGSKEASLMLGDVHLANFAENLMFFDLENSIGAYKLFFLSQEYYKNIGTLAKSSNFDAESVIYKTSLLSLKKKGHFSNHKNNVKTSFNKKENFNIVDLESSRIVLTDDFQINFQSQRIEFDLSSGSLEATENLKMIRKISDQMNILGTTMVKLVGHLDTSKVEEFKAMGMQQYLEASAQAKLISKKRAEFVKKVLVEKFGCDSDRILTEGMGWDMPVNNDDQNENRRVEVKFFSFE
ncbi:MAG: OmpA family protein [Spirochaetales bacterium]|nr:OmpA family protein [Spirochaetales bacterium]